MSESIHGHQVMEMLANSEKPITKDAFKTEIANQFGKECRFHTCMGSDLTADDLINFLVEKGKFIESEAGFLSGSHPC